MLKATFLKDYKYNLQNEAKMLCLQRTFNIRIGTNTLAY